MKKILLFFSLILPSLSNAQDVELEMKTTIQEVSVFLNNAQVFRTGKIDLLPGKGSIMAGRLSSYIDPQSIQVNARGNFIILGVNYSLNYLKEPEKTKMVEDLIKKIAVLDDSIILNKARIEVNKEVMDVLNKNKKLGNETTGTDINQLKLAVRYYEQEVQRLKKEDIFITKRIKDLELEKTKFSNQLNELYNSQNKPTGEIRITYQSEKAVSAEITLSYLVGNAGWFPQYDIRAKDIGSPVELKYKANVVQQTGEDWKDVKLIFSTANPSLTGTAPVFSPWYLDFIQPVYGTGRSVESRQMPAAMKAFDTEVAEEESLAEVVTTSVMESQTAINFVVNLPYTVLSDGENLLVDLNSYSITASYEYYGYPKFDKDAFLIAKISDWDQYNLLPGEVNLYFENTYVGKSLLDPAQQEDTLELSLGRDKNIIIDRVRIDEFSKKKILGATRTDSRGFSIKIRNNKSKAIQLSVLDQIPVSTRSELVITPLDLSGAQWDKTTGQLKWNLTLQPQEQKDLKFQYEVKYPKNQRIILE